MTTTKTYKLIMLPSTEKGAFCMSLMNVLVMGSAHSENNNYKNKHLYILSEDKSNVENGYDQNIKEGDYFYKSDSNTIECAMYAPAARVSFKIIASTDKNLGLPLIPKSFLPPFIKSYNEGKLIKEINLETEEHNYFIVQEDKELYLDKNVKESYVKTRQDNTVIICDDKKYTKEELFLEVINFAKWYSGMDQEKVIRAYNKWMEEDNSSILLK